MDTLLLQLGIVLFLLGLLTGFIIPAHKNLRLGFPVIWKAFLNGIFPVAPGLL
ncbi:MAG: hypothetical protein QME21_09275 [Anaerolineales bacterium]|nr:hypothetical protein [Anaerolineales bacterium]